MSVCSIGCGFRLQLVLLRFRTHAVRHRTIASLMRELDVVPKFVADQVGYLADVNLNVWT